MVCKHLKRRLPSDFFGIVPFFSRIFSFHRKALLRFSFISTSKKSLFRPKVSYLWVIRDCATFFNFLYVSDTGSGPYEVLSRGLFSSTCMGAFLFYAHPHLRLLYRLLSVSQSNYTSIVDFFKKSVGLCSFCFRLLVLVCFCYPHRSSFADPTMHTDAILAYSGSSTVFKKILKHLVLYEEEELIYFCCPKAYK